MIIRKIGTDIVSFMVLLKSPRSEYLYLSIKEINKFDDNRSVEIDFVYGNNNNKDKYFSILFSPYDE